MKWLHRGLPAFGRPLVTGPRFAPPFDDPNRRSAAATKSAPSAEVSSHRWHKLHASRIATRGSWADVPLISGNADNIKQSDRCTVYCLLACFAYNSPHSLLLAHLHNVDPSRPPSIYPWRGKIGKNRVFLVHTVREPDDRSKRDRLGRRAVAEERGLRDCSSIGTSLIVALCLQFPVYAVSVSIFGR